MGVLECAERMVDSAVVETAASSRRARGIALPLALLVTSGCGLLLPIHERDATADGGAEGGANGDAASSDAGASLCRSGLVFCEDFEGPLDRAWEELTSQGGTVAFDGTRAFRGSRALHARIPVQSAAGAAIAATVLHAQRWPDHFFVRWYAYLAAPLNAATNLLNVTEREQGIGLQLFLLGDPIKRSLVTVQFGVATERQITSSTSFPLEQWVCLESEVDAPNQIFRQWLDGSPVADLTQPFAAPALDALTVGLEVASAAAGPARETFVDELAVDVAPIGCGR